MSGVVAGRRRSASEVVVRGSMALLVVAALAAACSADPVRPGGATPRGTATDGPALGGSVASSTAPGTVTTEPPPAAPAPPGTLIDARRIDGPAHTHAWHLVYHSRSADDRDIAVTGLLVAPEAPEGDVPLITWGHPTTGSADRCAPSSQGTQSLPFPELLTGKGVAIVATDYEGLGTSDPHPYLVGASEGHAMLDAVRAARQVPGAGITAKSPSIIWGFSQGGHAAGFAGELAPRYAPDVNLKGVAIAAPVSDVEHFAQRAEGRSDQVGVLVTIVGGFAHAYPELDPATVFTSTVVGQLPELEQQCIGDVNIFFDRPVPDVVLEKPSGRDDFHRRFVENELGRAAIDAPVLVVQGGDDDIVDPADTHALVLRWCALGMRVASVVKPGVKHGVLSDQPYVDWILDRFANRAETSTCALDALPPASPPGSATTTTAAS